MIVDHKTLSKGRAKYFIYCQAASIDIDIDFHQGPLLLTWFNFNPSMDK